MNQIHDTAIIYEDVILEDNIYIGPGCIIGAPAEDKKTWGKKGKGVIIRNGAVLHGNVTVDSGTTKPTEIGHHAWLMKGVHVGHDANIGANTILSCHVLIGGHTVVESGTNIGLGAVAHQRLTIPANCMIGMNSTVTKKSVMREGYKYAGSPIRELGENKR